MPTISRMEHSVDQGELVTLDQMSQLTGFPTELIKQELLFDKEVKEGDRFPVSALRDAMLRYLDRTLVNE